MFTGIIQEIGKVKASSRQDGNLHLEIEAVNLAPKLKTGDSISINGACQTVVSFTKTTFQVEAVSETLSRTNLGELRNGSQVNLELPLGLSDLLHGHLVQGHIDCVRQVMHVKPLSGSTIYAISYPHDYSSLLIVKGSVAIDGVSLTVTEVSDTTFQVSLIPHTIENTIFKARKAGDSVNLEFDMVAKYIQKMITPHRGAITPDFLKENGF